LRFDREKPRFDSKKACKLSDINHIVARDAAQMDGGCPVT
jgi:hypothetical protein